MYRMDTVFFFILLVFEMLKIPRAKHEACFLKKLAFVTSKCLAQNISGECRRATENISKKQQNANSYVQKFFHFLVYSKKLSS